jgi:signal transduction histidine kinase
VLVSEKLFLADFVRSISEQFESYSGELQVKTPTEDLEFYIDKLRVRLLITNLLNNAARHGKGNLITVTVSFSDDRGIIEVKDNGEGISEEHISQISEPFYRADSSRQRNTGGFGLGLYLCRLIAQAHGGEMIIASQVGEGTHITVNLPRNNSPANAN